MVDSDLCQNRYLPVHFTKHKVPWARVLPWKYDKRLFIFISQGFATGRGAPSALSPQWGDLHRLTLGDMTQISFDAQSAQAKNIALNIYIHSICSILEASASSSIKPRTTHPPIPLKASASVRHSVVCSPGSTSSPHHTKRAKRDETFEPDPSERACAKATNV